jgi:hypothetical protein
LVFFLTRPAPDYTYNGYPFTRTACPGTDKICYFAELSINEQAYSIPFYYHPSQVEDVLFEYEALETLRNARARGNVTIIIGVPEGAPGQIGVAGSQLGRVLGKRYGILNFDVVPQVVGVGPEKADCDDGTPTTVVIAFQQGTFDGVFLASPNCIVLTSTSPEASIRVADLFVYRVFGIISTVRTTAPSPSVSAPESSASSPS